MEAIHPWADDIAKGQPLDQNMAASLASCLSIWPLSASALAAESTSGAGLDFSINGSASAIDLSRSLFDIAGDDGPIPKDWL